MRLMFLLNRWEELQLKLQTCYAVRTRETSPLGDFVVAINVEKMKFTGRKLEQVMYHHYTGYPGGLRSKSLKELMEKNPEMVLRRAVTNMIDDMKIRKQIMRRLKMVRGTKHEFNIDKKA